jgi:hypothetical protein
MTFHWATRKTKVVAVSSIEGDLYIASICTAKVTTMQDAERAWL